MSRSRVASRAFAVFSGSIVLALGWPALVLGQGGAVAPAQAPTAEVPAYQLRRALLEYAPWEPAVVPALSDDERTVFFNPSSLEGQAIQVFVQPREEVTAVPEAIFRVSPWLVPEGDRGDRLGDVIGPAGDQLTRGSRTTVHIHDGVRLSFVVQGSPRAGDEFIIYRVGREIEGVGDVMVPTGRVRVTGFDGQWTVARVIQEYGRIELGNHVGRVRAFLLQPGVHPQQTNLSLRAHVLAFQEVRELYLPGGMAFIDLGRTAGIVTGDEFVAYIGGGRDAGTGPTARFQVINVGDESATVRIIALRSPQLLRPGMELVLDRKMP